VLLPHEVCNALVAAGRLLGAEQQAQPVTHTHILPTQNLIYKTSTDIFGDMFRRALSSHSIPCNIVTHAGVKILYYYIFKVNFFSKV